MSRPPPTPEQRAALDRAKRPSTFNVPIEPRGTDQNRDRIVPLHTRLVRR